LKVLLVNLLAALKFANVFLKNKNVWKIKKTLKRKNVTKIKNVTFYIYGCNGNTVVTAVFMPPAVSDTEICPSVCPMAQLP